MFFNFFSIFTFIGSIYAVGGEGHNSAERYDPREGFWNNISTMRFKRGGVAAVVLNSEIYAIGNYCNYIMQCQPGARAVEV